MCAASFVIHSVPGLAGGTQLENVLANDAPYTVGINGQLMVSVPMNDGALLVLNGTIDAPPAAPANLQATRATAPSSTNQSDAHIRLPHQGAGFPTLENPPLLLGRLPDYSLCAHTLASCTPYTGRPSEVPWPASQ